MFLSPLLLGASVLLALAPPRIERLAECSGPRALTLSGDSLVAEFIPPAVPAWIEIEPNGQEVVVTSDPFTEVAVLPFPPRYGLQWLVARSPLQLTVHRAEGEGGIDPVRVTLHCPDDNNAAARLVWLDGLARAVSQPVQPSGAAPRAPSAGKFDVHAQSAPDQHDRAFAIHAKAQALLVASKDEEALFAFEAAESEWRATGDRQRAAAARTARVELLNRRSRFADALALAGSFSSSTGKRSHYEARVASAGCTALDYLGRWPDAAACYRAAASDFQRLGEKVEQANTLRNAALVQLELGDTKQGEALARTALPLAIGTWGPLIRGRIHLVLSDLALLRADLAGALQSVDAARRAFGDASAAAAQPSAWEIASLLKSATIYREIGANDEAYRAITQAFRLAEDRGGPADAASALLALARLAQEDGNLDGALRWSRAAASIYRRTGVAREHEAALLASVRAALDLGRHDDVERDWPALADVSALNRPARDLLAVERDLRGRDFPAARRGLDGLLRQPLGLGESIDRARLESAYWRAQGDARRARHAIDEAAHSIATIARASGSGILRRLVARQVEALQSEALAGALPPHGAAPAPDEARIADAWHWLALRSRLDEAVAPADIRPGRPNADRFDTAVARELLLGGGKGAKAAESSQPALLSLLAQAGSGARGKQAEEEPVLTLAEVQSRLEPGAMLVAWLQSGERAGLLLVTHDAVALSETTSPETLRRDAAALRKLLLSPSNPTADIDAAARKLAADLWRDAPAWPQPTRLLVLAGSTLDGLPWALLPWKGSDEPLATTTTPLLVRLTHVPVETGTSPPQLAIVVAAQDGRAGAIGELPAAASEAAAIRGSIPPPARVAVPRHADRANVLELLARPRGWLHVAAHGLAQPSRLGYAGIWLDPPSRGDLPQFLSWLDVLEQGVAADLVVLDACQLGDSGDAVRGSIGFASAVSQAGARQVVAALWPVSDSASTLWAPTFWSTVAADPTHDAAAALHAAQRTLRNSRRFRHPFYWAGLQAFGPLALGKGSDTKALAAATPAPPPAPAHP